MYINDITSVTQCKLKLFADDTIIYLDVENHAVAANCLNNDLVKIEQWAEKWLINFSPQNTKLMTCSFKDPPNIPLSFRGQQLTSVASHKHLVLTLSNTLS